MRSFIVSAWKFIFDHEFSPLRNIPDVGVQHMVFQILAWMWSIVFGISIGSYAVFGITMVAHSLFIAAIAITVATYSTATIRPTVFVRSLGRQSNGEHV